MNKNWNQVTSIESLKGYVPSEREVPEVIPEIKKELPFSSFCATTVPRTSITHSERNQATLLH